MLCPFFSSSLLVRSGISTAFSSGHLTIVVFRLGYVVKDRGVLEAFVASLCLYDDVVFI
jgi:hypothetical protein